VGSGGKVEQDIGFCRTKRAGLWLGWRQTKLKKEKRFGPLDDEYDWGEDNSGSIVG